MANKYGEVNSSEDITRINKQIRQRMRHGVTGPMLTKLIRESLYLVTLTASPAWGEHLGSRIGAVRARAKEEYTTTARLANSIVGEHHYDEYWGSSKR